MLAVRRTLMAVGALVAVAIVGGAVVAFVTFGLGPSAPPSADPTASVIASATTSTDAPAAFRNRPPFASCGQIVVPQGGTVPADRIACLSAAPGEGRELVVVLRTAEGDPIVRYYRAGPDITGVEIWEDDTADRFSGGWHRTDCRSGQIDQSGACA